MKTKICKSCKLEKGIDEFYIRKNSKPCCWCKTCSKKMANNHYKKYKSEHIDRANRRTMLFKTIVNTIKEKYGCSECGIKINQCLDFHHVGSDKDYNIAQLTNCSVEKIINEINKCCVLCANHHRMLHGKIELTKPLIQCSENLDDFKLNMVTNKPSFGFNSNVLRPRKNYIKKQKIKKERQQITKIEWPTPEKLKELVWSRPTSKIAKELGVSDSAIAKRCRRLGIEKPRPGYWSKRCSIITGE